MKIVDIKRYKKIFCRSNDLRFSIEKRNGYFYYFISLHIEGWNDRLIRSGHLFFGGQNKPGAEKYSDFQLKARKSALDNLENFLTAIQIAGQNEWPDEKEKITEEDIALVIKELENNIDQTIQLPYR